LIHVPRINECLGRISTPPAHAADRPARDRAAGRTLVADQHAFGRIPCRSRNERSAVLAMVTTANRGYAGLRCRARRIPGRVRSCDNASSGACAVPAATSRPRSGGSGLDALRRGHDQSRARGRWPRGVPVPLARLEGGPSGPGHRCLSITPRGRPGHVPIQTVRRECGQGLENAGPVGCCEAGAETQTLFQGRCWAVLGSAHRCASLVDSAYDLSLIAAGPVAAMHARDR